MLSETEQVSYRPPNVKSLYRTTVEYPRHIEEWRRANNIKIRALVENGYKYATEAKTLKQDIADIRANMERYRAGFIRASGELEKMRAELLAVQDSKPNKVVPNVAW